MHQNKGNSLNNLGAIVVYLGARVK